MLHHLTVCLKSAPENQPARHAAVEIARQVDGVLTGVYVRTPAPPALPAAFPLTGFAVGEPIAFSPGTLQELDERVLAHEVEQDRRQEAALSGFLRMAANGGVRASTIVREGAVQEEIVRASQATDLVVLGHGTTQGEGSVIGSVTGAIVRAVARPVLVVPRWDSPLERIVVAYDGSTGADRALAAAADLAVHWRARQPEIVVVGITRREHDPIAFLSPARRYLNAYDLPHRMRTASGDPAQLIDAVALDEDADLLAVGAFKHSLMRDVLLGSTTQALLAAWRRPLLLCH